MKSMKCFKAAMMFALGALVFTACDDDDNRLQVPEAVQGAFTQKYGNETRVEWDMEKQYAVAEFWKDNREHDAWFTMDGAWLMTEVDYGRQIADLPQSVQDGFNASQYAQWTIDDIDKIERNNYEDVYKIEVEQGKQEMDLYFDVTGNLFKEVVDGNDDRNEGMLPSQMPAAIQSVIDEKYPNARIVDFELERGQYEVELVYNNQSIEMIFDGEYNWVRTSTDMERQVPAVVRDAVAAQYPGKVIDDCDFVETASEKYYLVDLDNYEPDLKVSEDGTSITEVNY